jgi:adenosylcobinamide kinase / adenosylcobinamide-phosphate guanylyltransferase
VRVLDTPSTQGGARRGTPRTTLVLGGARSGKSRHAENLVIATGLRPVYLATAEVGDEGMAARVERHRRRRGPAWTTVEEPLELVEALARHSTEGTCVLVDCLTLWLSSLLWHERDPEREVEALARALPSLRGPVVLVSNEVGMSVHPETPLGRAFRDHQGDCNQVVAAACERVLLVVAGLPLTLKPPPA